MQRAVLLQRILPCKIESGPPATETRSLGQLAIAREAVSLPGFWLVKNDYLL